MLIPRPHARWATFAPDGAGWARPGRAADDDVYRFYRAPGGPLWIATMRGLHRWDGDAASGAGRLAWLDAPLRDPLTIDFATCPDGSAPAGGLSATDGGARMEP